MATSIPNQYPDKLSKVQRRRLTAFTRTSRAPVGKLRRAQVLLLSDHRRPGGNLSRAQISEVLGMHVNTIDRVRRRFALEGEIPTLNRKARTTPPVAPKRRLLRFVAVRHRKVERAGR